MIAQGMIEKSFLDFYHNQVEVDDTEESTFIDFTPDQVHQSFKDISTVLNSDEGLYCYTVINEKSGLPVSEEILEAEKSGKIQSFFHNKQKIGLNQTVNEFRSFIPYTIRNTGSYLIEKFTFNDHKTKSEVNDSYEKAVEHCSSVESIPIKTTCRKWDLDKLFGQVYEFCLEAKQENCTLFVFGGW
ncbi:MAG: hypothetical protein IPO07_28195 [Haliscomenobacter sp.]|nr:hypothetical protein [Haliscomenobacter sp.]MBK9492236.1 hypothetical protein [Haliscomenobacter sp.]